MPLEVTNLTRVFKISKNGKDTVLPDPNPQMTVEEVMKFYGSQYPELTNGISEGPKVVGDNATYTFTTKAGKLG
jgi:PRTRC genetic system protein C